MPVPIRRSGPSGIALSALGLGSWNTWNRADPETVMATLRTALDAGVNFFDVGIYGAGPGTPDAVGTESRFAAALRELGIARDEWLLAAKAWLPEPRMPDAPDIPRQLDTLLSRLGTDHADILVLGDLMVEPEDYSQLLDAVGAVIRAGSARAWAVNNWSAAQVDAITAQARGMGIPAPDYAQHKYGLTRRTVPEGEPFRTLGERTGVRVQASDVFEGGLLFGSRQTGSARPVGGDIGGTHARLRAETGHIRAAAASLGATPAQLAIAVPLLNEQTANVLVGARTPEQLRDNLGAFDLLDRYAAAEILAVADPFWLDREAVSPDASWGATPADDPASYVVCER